MTRPMVIALLVLAASACGSQESDGDKARVAQLEKQLAALEAERDELEGQVSKLEGAEVKLPSGAVVAVDGVRLSISTTGEIRRDQKPVDDAGLDALFKELASSEGQVVLEVERGVEHRRVVEIMDRARSAGVTKIGIATAPAE